MDAPERIWIEPKTVRTGGFMSALPTQGASHTAEYIRADLVPQWQPIETAPKDGTEFLGTWRYGGWSVSPMVWKLGVWCRRFDVNSTHAPTHWMPLPTPPKEGE